LRAALDLDGWILFALTWKVRATPSGRPILQQRALARRNDDSGFGLWPTPKADDDTGAQVTPRGNYGRALQVSPWRAPLASDGMAGSRFGFGNLKNLGLARLVVSGQKSNGSPAATGKLGRLNADLSRWLMGYPVEWLLAAPASRRAPRHAKTRERIGTPASGHSGDSGMQSSRKSRRRSSARRT
jgi:hypothetical protein